MLTVSELNDKENCSFADIQNTKEVYASALAYALKESNVDRFYGSQAIGIVGDCYCVVTSTSQGLYAQPEAGVILPINNDDVAWLRAL